MKISIARIPLDSNMFDYTLLAKQKLAAIFFREETWQVNSMVKENVENFTTRPKDQLIYAIVSWFGYGIH